MAPSYRLATVLSQGVRELHAMSKHVETSKHHMKKTETTQQRNQFAFFGPVAQVPLTGDMFEFDGVFDMTSSQAAKPRSLRFPTPVFHI